MIKMAKEKYYRNRRLESLNNCITHLLQIYTSKKKDIGRIPLKSLEKIEQQLKEWANRGNDSSIIPEKRDISGE